AGARAHSQQPAAAPASCRCHSDARPGGIGCGARAVRRRRRAAARGHGARSLAGHRTARTQRANDREGHHVNDTVNGRHRAAGMLALMTLGAIALRLLMFTGRGDYVAFDEGWYLLLGRSLLSGDGYSLAGLRHTVLSPLFPILAGAMSFITGDIIWAGRVVAALCAGLLVVPCWFLFRRLADEGTAWIGCLIVIAVPTLAPFTVPFWIAWDLWVGAEPVLHLFLYGGLALALRAHDTRRVRDWLLAGLAFALAYLARPEAILVLG